MKHLLYFLPFMVALPAAAQIPGDSIRATVDSGQVHGRFVMWSDTTLQLSNATLYRGTILDLEVWDKRDAGSTFALSFLLGLAMAGINYYGIEEENRSAAFAIGSGLVVTFGGYGLSMALTPGKWKSSEEVRRFPP